MHTILFPAVTTLLLCLTAFSAEAQVTKSAFWKVDLTSPQEVEISAGDMLLVTSRSYAVVPANLKKTFEIAYDRGHFRLIAEEPPEGEGRLGKQYFFLALSKACSKVTLTVKDQGQVIDTVTLNVTCH